MHAEVEVGGSAGVESALRGRVANGVAEVARLERMGRAPRVQEEQHPRMSYMR